MHKVTRRQATREVGDAAVFGKNTDAGVDPMVATGEEPQHAAGVVAAGGFSENFIFHADDGVSGEDHVFGISEDGAGLFFGDPLNEASGDFGGEAELGNGGWLNDVIDAGGEEKFVAARGSGSEDEHSEQDSGREGS